MIIALQTLVYFRQSFMTALDRALRPYYKRFSLVFNRNGEDSEEEEPDEQVFSEFDEEKGVVFYPPMYAQRYAAVSDCLMDERWCGKLEKVVDFGYHDMSFIKYLKEVPGIQRILGVDIESIPLRCSSDLFGGEEYSPKRESPLQVTLFQGNAADPDYRLIGCDAVIAIEMIEHMLPHDLDRLVHNVFGFIKPWIAVFTTPNGDFNVLFKALEKNGLRRWDHYFEWSREQFHEWCSNIILRYPQYTVTCQGIGPGPPGTLHHGCCSQLALFVNKNYQKHPDLDIDSLALVPKVLTPKPLNDLIDCWDSTDVDNSTLAEMEQIAPATGIESFTEFLFNDNRSHMTFMVTPALTSSLPIFHIYPEEETLVSCCDKMLQCNLDTESGKNFLMFDEEEPYQIRVARRRTLNRVYMIEDVACRLNCTTLQVKKFSKTTQNLMAKNKIDALVHTREVVGEIRHLTRTLNFNKCIMNRPEDGTTIWCNINWGDNAPYWNQYYKVVREFNCPFETKSEECRILDLVSDEINRMIDMQFDEFSYDVNRLEIPMSHLMSVVQHITDDIDRVRDLLEWNGYEIVKDVVIHSRLVVDTGSVATHDEDWQDNDTTISDWDNVTELRSTTVSEGSTIVPDYHDRCLRRALDHKVRNLRSMLTADEDITTELDKVVCRLMKLALRTSRGRANPPPTKWMQCKLLDLLTLTEKAIGRRKKHYFEKSLKAIEFPFRDEKKQEILSFGKPKDDPIAKEIENNYRHIISSAETSVAIDENTYQCHDLEHEDDLLSTTSNEFLKDVDFAERLSPIPVVPPVAFKTKSFEDPKPEKVELSAIERTKAWLNVDVEVVPHCTISKKNYENISSEDTNSPAQLRHKPKKSKHKAVTNKELETALCITSPSRSSSIKFKSKNEDKKRKTSSTRVTKKVARKLSGCYNIVKKSANKYQTDDDNCIVKPKKRAKDNRCLTVRASKPIPESIIDLCHPELKVEKGVKEFNVFNNVNATKNIVISNEANPIADTKESVLIDTITNDTPETIDLHKTIGTDAKAENAEIFSKGQVELCSNDIDVNLFTRHEVSTENICAQTIFLNDINEPSTSKGIRHNVSMDVQCGPDTLAAYPMLSASTSLVRMPPVFAAGIKIHDGVTDTYKAQGTDFGTSTQDCCNDKILTPRSRSVGIKIKDSDVNICATIESCTSSQLRNQSPDSSWARGRRSWSPESNMANYNKNTFPTKSSLSPIRTELLKPISSTVRTDSGSEVCMSVGNFAKSSSQFASIDANEMLILKPSEKFSNAKCSKPKLCCGGVYVHSYKDKQESEDIVYQGEWQQYRGKAVRRKPHNTIVAKKINESGNRKVKDTAKKVNSKDKIPTKKPEKKEIKVEHRKPLQMRNAKLHKAKQETTNYEANKFSSVRPKTAKFIPNTMKPNRPTSNVTKVASKIAMSSVTSKNVKSAFTAKKPQITTSTVNKEPNPQKLKKSYIPLYMKKRKAEILDKSNLNKSIDSVTTDIEAKEIKNKQAPLVRSKTDEIRKDLLSFHEKITTNTYLVFRNEKQENCESAAEQQTSSTTNNDDASKPNESFTKRSLSRQSLTSSTCSSPNSVSTVRAVNTKSKNTSYRRYSATSHKSSLNTNESDSTSPTRTKKVVKRSKSARKSDSSHKDLNNKENIPEVENFASKESEKLAKSPFVSQNKNVCIAQLKTDRSSMQTATDTSSKHKAPNKSNIKIPAPEESVEKKRSASASLSRKRSLKSGTSSLKSITVPSQNMSYGSSECANMVLLLNPQELITGPQNVASADSTVKSVENSLLTEWIQNSNFESETNISANYVRQLLDDLIDFIDFPNVVIESTTFVANLNEVPHYTVEQNESMTSFETVTAEYLNSTFLGSASLNRTFDTVLGDESIISLNDTRLTVTDLDLLSFKSITSESKHSEYFLANSELNAAVALIDKKQTSGAALAPSSVTDIFERKEPCLLQTAPGPLAIQAFSGFSLAGDPITGDQPDPIALFDSETGSLAVDVARQTTSEELYISGRSSESYESCVIDEDAVVPNWLFQIISQQQSQSIEEQPLIGPQLPPMAEPVYDMNGNPDDGAMIGASAGAGDGRGIHSDQSQDSSGRGTSLSSTDTSSSQQSEVSQTMLLDPAAFAAQFEMLRDPTATGNLAPGESSEMNSRQENLSAEDADAGSAPGHAIRRPRTPLNVNVTSDFDADISSIDTDVPDSSDN